MERKEIIDLLRDDNQYYGEFGRKFLSNSDVGNLLSDPKQFKVQREDNAAFAFGRLFHQSILEPEKAKDWEFVDVSSRNTKAYKEFCKENELKFALLQKEADQVKRLVETMLTHIEFYDMIYNDGNIFEEPSVGEIQGHEWKGKSDIIHPEMLIDLKTTSDITKFRYSASKYNYDSQSYIYEQLFGKRMVFLVIDKNTQALGIFEASDEFVDRGKQKVSDALKVYDTYFAEGAPKDVGSYYIREVL